MKKNIPYELDVRIRIKIDGTINTYIMYLADSESNNIRSINTNLDFSQTINTLTSNGIIYQ